MADFSTIYVNLSLPDDAYTDSSYDEFRTSTGRLICNSTTGIGSVNTPLNYVEFREYTSRSYIGDERSRNVTFIFWGKYTINASDIYHNSRASLFTFRYAESVIVESLNPEENFNFKVTYDAVASSNDIPEDYRFVNIDLEGYDESATQTADNGTDLTISNMDLDIEGDIGSLRFSGADFQATYPSKVYMFNCRVYIEDVVPRTKNLYGRGVPLFYSYAFVVFQDVRTAFVVNNIFNSKNSSLYQVAIIFKPQSRTNVNNYVTFDNNVCVNISEMYKNTDSTFPLYTSIFNNSFTSELRL